MSTTVNPVQGYDVVYRRRRPVPGARSTPAQKCDWTLASSYELNVHKLIDSQALNFVQSVDIDNTYSPFMILVQTDTRTLRIAAGACAQVPVSLKSHAVSISVTPGAGTSGGILQAGQAAYTTVSLGNFAADGVVWTPRVPIWGGVMNSNNYNFLGTSTTIGGSITVTTGANTLFSVPGSPMTAASISNFRGTFVPNGSQLVQASNISIELAGSSTTEWVDAVNMPAASTAVVPIGVYPGSQVAQVSGLAQNFVLNYSASPAGNITFVWSATITLYFDV